MKKSLIVLSCFAFATAAFAAGNFPREGATVSQEEVDQHLSDVNQALTEARAIPYFENGKPAGYRKVPKKSAGNYQMLELKNADIVTAPNPDYIPPAKAPTN